MTNSQYIDAYKKTQQSSNSVTSSHEIVRTLMKELVNSMQKIVLDIQDERKRKQDEFSVDKDFEEKYARQKSKNLSKSLSIIYGLQTSLDFDKALEIANNLFQLYEYCRHEIIKGFSQKIEDGYYQSYWYYKTNYGRMGRNTIFREIKMDNFNSDLDLLENLSKKISDLIYNNEFSQISFIDAQRRALIKKIIESEGKKNAIKKRIGKLLENNFENIKATENKLQNLSKNHNKFSKRLKAYSSIKY